MDSGLLSTGFRIPIVSGLRIPRVVFRSPKRRILDSMGKHFLDSRFHEQKLPGFRGRILYNGAIGENWFWSLLRLNGLRPGAIIAQRLSEFETYQVRSQERLHMLTVFGSRKIISLCRTGKRKKNSHSLDCVMLFLISYGKWKNEQTVCLQSERSRHIEQWIQSIRLWIWFEIGRG